MKSDVAIKKLTKEDVSQFAELIALFAEVFEQKSLQLPPQKYLEKLLAKESFIVFVAEEKSIVIGGLTAYVLDGYYTSKPTAYIYDIAVAKTHQRRGIGRALIAAIKKYCVQNDFEEAYVEAESDDIDAINFYKQTAYSSSLEATHFVYKA